MPNTSEKTSKEQTFCTTPKVSIVMPCYNMANFIRDSLDSLTRQTLQDYELLCVDDGSTDETPAIIREYADKDNRITLVCQENMGVFAARNKALSIARGEYVCFLDPDDWYPEDSTLQKMYAAAAANDADICGGGWSRHFPDGRVVSVFEGNMSGLNAFPGCGFVDYHDYQFDLGYQRFLYRRTLIMDNGILFPPYKRFQDPPFFVKAMAAAGRFYGLDFTTYCYRVGHKSVDWRSDGYRKLKDYMRGLADNLRVARANGLDVLWRTTYERCCGSFFWQTAGAAIAGDLDVFKVFLGMFDDPTDAVYALAKGFARHPREIGHMIEVSGWIRPIVPRKIQTIGIHYFHLTPGGVQRVIAIQIRQFIDMGYKVRLFIEEEQTEDCFSVPDEVEVVKFPACFGKDAPPPPERVRMVAEVLRSHPVDIFYSHCHVCPMMLWDILAVKAGAGIPYVLHFHSMFTAMLYAAWETSQDRFLEAQVQHRMCDLVIALSRVDCAYERLIGARVVYLPNPTDDVLKSVSFDDCHSSQRRVVWVGRIDENKNPLDAIRVFAKVHEALPDVKFRMIGGGTKWLVDRVAREVELLKLKDCVEMTGAKTDVYGDYMESSVYLSTSRIEGFPMCSLEALCHGLPIVAYRLPQVELYRDNDSVRVVRQGDVNSAAEEIVDILKAPDIEARRARAKESVKKFTEYDYTRAWRRIFGMLAGHEKFADPGTTSEDQALMCDVLNDGIAAMRNRIGTLRQQVNVKDKQLLADKEAIAKATAASAELEKKLLADKEAIAKATAASAEMEKKLLAAKAENDRILSAANAEWDKKLRSVKAEADKLRGACDVAKRRDREAQQALSKVRLAAARAENEVSLLKHSEAYRVGMVITWPARKIWRLIGRIKELAGNKRTLKH